MEKPKTTTILRLTFEEMLHINAILELGLAARVSKTKRGDVIESAQKKIWAVLEQAERDGLFDPTKVKT